MSAASFLSKGRGRQDHGHNLAIESTSASTGFAKVLKGSQVFQAMSETMKDIARAIHDEVLCPPLPLPHLPMREVSLNLLEVRHQRYMRDLSNVIHLLLLEDPMR